MPTSNIQSTLTATAAAAREDVTDMGRQAVVAAAGLLTTLAVVGVNAWLSRALGLNVLSMSVWLIIPAGAAAGGMAAASGYYAGARVTQTMPTKQLAWSTVVIALGAWFLSHWFEYTGATLDDGTHVRDVVDFWRFLQITTVHQSLSISARPGMTGVSTGELGALGYVREALQILGFMAGGFMVYAFLGDVEACAGCRRYAKTTTIMRGVSAEQFDGGMSHVGATLPGLGEQAVKVAAGRRFLGMNLHLAECPNCHAFWVRPEAVVQNGRSAEARRLGRYDASPDFAARVLALPAEFRTPVKA